MNLSTNNEVYTWGPSSHGVTLHIDEEIRNFYSPLVIDIETDEKDNFVGIALCSDDKYVYYYSKMTIALRHTLESMPLAGHNVKADVQWLRKWGINVQMNNVAYDTMLASYTQDSTKSSHSLKELAKEILGYEYPAYRDITGTGKSHRTLDLQPLPLVANYCGMDAYATFRLLTYFQRVLTESQKKYLNDIELPTMRALLLMEERGVTVNAAYLRTLDYKFNVENQRIVETIKLLAPSIENVNSDKQVGDFLVSKGFTLPKTPTGKNSVSVKSLEVYEGVPFVKSLRRYSELEKLIGTYVKPLLEKSNASDTYRLHAWFNQAITHTGRLSSSNPNLQNIPTRTNTGSLLRRAFVAGPGCTFIDADYSQIEPRLFAHFSQDPELLKIFNQGLDLYDYVAASIGATRSVAKTVWLALSYNAGAFKIAQTAKIPVASAYMFIDKMQKKFKTAFDWKQKLIRDTECLGYVDTMFGRRIKLSKENACLGPNYKVQGSAAEIMKLAIVATADYEPVLTVHDELLFELENTPKMNSAQKIKNIMESVVKLSVPLVVEVGTGGSWADAKG